MGSPILELRNVRKSFGGLVAVSDVSFTLGQNQIKALIGPNGAGKTTIFNLITGVFPLTSGEIVLRGRRVMGFRPFEIARSKLARTFQNVLLFPNMTVLENVMVGCHQLTRTRMLSCALRLSKSLSEEGWIAERSLEMLRLVGLEAKAHIGAGDLPFGEQRLLEVARALATDPQILLLDEPAAGLSSLEKENLADLVRKIRDKGITVLLVEHNMDMVMDISDEVVVLDHGTKIAEGTPERIQSDERVLAAYLGEESP